MVNRFFKMKTSSTVMLSMAMLVVVGSGCSKVFESTPFTSKLFSGANLKPTVKYRPSTTAGAAAESATAAEATTEVASSDGVGTLKGKVELVGAFTPLPPLYAKGSDVKDAAVCAAEAAPNQEVVEKNGGLANVFIYLKKAPKTVPPPVADAMFVFDQKGCVFKPHAMITRVGQTIRVLNSDSVAHNTHTYGKRQHRSTRSLIQTTLLGLR